MTDTVHDPVNRPAHYQGKGLEAIQVIEDWELGYHLGNAVKYILRAGKKGDRKQDLEKALWYVRRAKKFPEMFVAGPPRYELPQVAEAFDLGSTEACALYQIWKAKSAILVFEGYLGIAERHLEHLINEELAP